MSELKLNQDGYIVREDGNNPSLIVARPAKPKLTTVERAYLLSLPPQSELRQAYEASDDFESDTGMTMFAEYLIPGTYNVPVPTGTNLIYVDGAGGGAGGGAGFASGSSGGGGGGGGSGCSARLHPVRIPPTTTRLQITIGAPGAGGIVGGAAAGAGTSTIILDPDAPTGAYSQVLLTLNGAAGTVAQPGTTTNGGNGGGTWTPQYANGGAGGGSGVAGSIGNTPATTRSGTYFHGSGGAGGGGASAAGGQTNPVMDFQAQAYPGVATGAQGGGGAGGMTCWAETWTGRRGYHGLAGGVGVPYGNDVPGAGGAGGGCNVNGNPGGAGFLRIYL